MFRPLLAATVLVAAPAALLAQQPAEGEYCTDAAPPQAMRMTFTGPADLVRVPLCGGVKYIAETSLGGSSLQLRFRPLVPGTPVPMVREGMMGSDVQGGRNWVVDVKTTGIFEVRVDGIRGIPVDVTFTPRVDRSKEQAAEKARKDQEKAAEKARKEQEKAAEKARKEQEKAAKEAEKARQKQEKEAAEAAKKAAEQAQ